MTAPRTEAPIAASRTRRTGSLTRATARARPVGSHGHWRQSGHRQRDLSVARRRRAADWALGPDGVPLGRRLPRCSIALCFAEVGSRFDRTGGPYLPARVAYGRFIGFEVGWMMWFTRVASQASVSQWPGAGAGLLLARRSTGGCRACAAHHHRDVVLAWINIRGIKQSSWVVNTLTVGKLAPLCCSSWSASGSSIRRVSRRCRTCRSPAGRRRRHCC